MRITFSLIVLCLSAVLFTSCNMFLRSSIKADGKQVPPDFGAEGDTLLVIEQAINSYDKYLHKHFKKRYSGPYIIILREEMFSDQYADTKKYKYVFGQDISVMEFRTRESYPIPERRECSKFFIMDRDTNKHYRTKRCSGRFAAPMKIYIEVIEKERKKNSAAALIPSI